MPEKKITKAIVCPMCGEMSKADVYTVRNKGCAQKSA